MKLNILASLMLILASGFAHAWGSSSDNTKEHNGTMTVVRPFSIVRTRHVQNPKPVDKAQVDLRPGTYDVELGSYSANEYSPCLPPFCANSRYEVPVKSFDFYHMKKLKGIDEPMRLRWAAILSQGAKAEFQGDYAIVSGAAMGQSFDMISSSKTSETRKGNYRTEEQECSVKMSCRGGSDGYYGGYYGYGYGYGCKYAMGVQKIRVHDETQTTTQTTKFVVAGTRQLLATHVKKTDYTEKKVDSEGKCILNKHRYDND